MAQNVVKMFGIPNMNTGQLTVLGNVGFVLVTENKVRQLLHVSAENHKIPNFCAFLSLVVLSVTAG
jgi:hypothetical protein